MLVGVGIRLIWNKPEIVQHLQRSTVPQTKNSFLSGCRLKYIHTKLLCVVFKYPVYAEWTEIRSYSILYTLLPVLLFGALVCANANQVQW